MHSRDELSPGGRAFDKVLVANRGEIARRILRTLKEMGLASVAVFSDADREALHVREADEAVRLGPAPSRESYLDQAAVIEAARRSGAQAVHPGYGFLAENADFARRCREAGLVFIGPSAEAIARMGRKDEAKELAASVGVPVLGGFALDGLEEAQIRQQAEELGFPLLVKAAAGGGGKGMRAVERAEDLADAIAAAGREAESAFGDGALLVERLLEAPRHVEVQVFGDSHGHVTHLFERDCSVQRRHQKVFEEAPSPAVDEDLRRRMGEAAVVLAAAVGYEGAGTVEFLLAGKDGQEEDQDGEFFFLEMNTRLQVEHPVTEEVVKANGRLLDLVRLQVEVAQGKALPFRQDELEIDGHAVEARLYAEDASADFLPATGELTLWHVPELPGLRVDSGVEAGDVVTVHYDPLLAKVIAHGESRDEAVRRLRRGLEELAVGGLVTNRDFLLAVLTDEGFMGGHTTTRFLAERPELQEPAPADAFLHAVAGAMHLVLARRGRPSPLPAGLPRGWRNNRWRAQEQIFDIASERVEVRYVEKEGDRFDVTLGEQTEKRTLDVTIVGAPGSGDSQPLVLDIDGVRRRFRVAGPGTDDGGRLSVHGLGRIVEFDVVPRFPARRAEAVAGGCAAPMTGLVVDVLVEEGERVCAGAPLVILEAMKMEHRLEASFDGVVEAVLVEKGAMVDPDEVLVVVTPHEEGEAS